ncbi:translation initiation factor IF-2-like [Cebus imitator]|uniref:translation initiation factor IF-2-like n=1 Tax=Cebus imitator TaxID=2715852 RepID=UPI001897DCA3|nr:translation initiation factor IF-2-like [Cebus imitator]
MKKECSTGNASKPASIAITFTLTWGRPAASSLSLRFTSGKPPCPDCKSLPFFLKPLRGRGTAASLAWASALRPPFPARASSLPTFSSHDSSSPFPLSSARFPFRAPGRPGAAGAGRVTWVRGHVLPRVTCPPLSRAPRCGAGSGRTCGERSRHRPTRALSRDPRGHVTSGRGAAHVTGAAGRGVSFVPESRWPGLSRPGTPPPLTPALGARAPPPPRPAFPRPNRLPRPGPTHHRPRPPRAMAAPGSARRPLLLLLGLLHCASSVFVVKNSNGTVCIMANFSAAFSVNYDSKSGPKVGSTTVLHASLVCAGRWF